MKMRKDRDENGDRQKVDARVLARILAAQNIDFVLPDLPHIAEFFAETLLTIPGIHACRVCLQGVTIQKGTMKIEICEECRKSRMLSSGQKELSPFLPDPNFKCGLADQPGFQVQPVISLYHHFGFFTFNVGEPGAFEIYRPFISNLASFMALSLENRLQRDALQKARITLENEVADRTQELLAANSRLKEEVETRRRAEEHLQEREKHSQSLLRLSKRLERAQTYAEVLDTAQDEVRATIGYKNLWVYLISEDKQYAHSIVAGGPIEEVVMSEEGVATLTIKGDRMLEEILESKDIVVVEDAQTDERVNKEIVKQLGNRTIVNIPIILFNRHMGSIGTGTFSEEGVRVPTASERDYLMALASHMAVTLERIHQFRERIKIEESLTKSEEKFRTIIEQSAEGILMADEGGTIVEWNHAYEKMTGVRRSEALGHPLWDIMMKIIAPERATAERRETIKTGILDALRTGKSYLFDQPIEMEFYPLSSQEKHYFHQTIFPIKTAKGYRIASLIEDITERKHHELERDAIITVSQALRKATTRSEILTVLLDQLVSLFDADGSMIALPNPETKDIIIEMGRGVVGERFNGLVIPQGSGISSLVIANKEPYLNNRANHDLLFYRPDLLGDSVCVASVPMIAHEKAIGALWIARHTSIFEEELRLMTAIADIAANAIHRVILYEQTIQQLHHLLALHQIDLAISTNFDLDLTLDVLLKNVKDELEVDAADILLFDTITHTLDYAHGIGFRTRGIKESRVRLGDGYAGRAARDHCTVSCPDLRRAEKTFSRSSLLVDEKFVAYFVSSLVSKGQIKGVLEVFTRKPFQPEKEWLDYFETLATQATIAIESANLFENLQRSNADLTLAYDATIEGWSLALDLRDKETEGHTRRVMEMALNLAGSLGMNESEMLNLKRGALLHDIGKMGVPDAILLKQGPLTTEEWEIMHQHPAYAYHMLESIAYLEDALEVPYCHHEHWDGSGYPRGLRGEEIPLAARVFAVVDVFDALTSDRPYRCAWPNEKAYRYIESQAGKHFDPKVVKIFLENR
ncbi:MAG: GAF domain-containing protein [Anaerolineaceae bacterium]|nr:MAG: GAF domain-containing protein [Anaerolineaceae bacterium]